MAMNIEEIRKLAEVMAEIGVTEIEIEEEGRRIRLSKQSPMATLLPSALATFTPSAEISNITSATPQLKEATILSEKVPDLQADCRTICSPMIGTFYRSASPDSEPLINIGDKVTVHTPVCVLEAMKVMNEILSDVDGTIVDIPIKNGEPVEFGQVLFYVKAAAQDDHD
ncbi:MAG: acetyl-CoA carboxylase biotin carboxyl carrier protein [Puniceicoccales bacterium]|jgi:acetyl-CoA carboxylase biotin carboxyl carrier protein|nr:acetyl-CoA carboxylase biotin carboxyl carrier protein [Puniceicoccales bacterium]